MIMDCGTSTAKYGLFTLNLLTLLIGILDIFIGVSIFVGNDCSIISRNGDGVYLLETLALICLVLLILIGAIVVFISFCGCCGAITESVCMTVSYATFLCILLILQLAFSAVLWIFKRKLMEVTDNLINGIFDGRSSEADIHEIENTFHCCGKNGVTDYLLSLQTPPSRCCAYDNCFNPENYYGGCKPKVEEFVQNTIGYAEYFSLAVIFVEFICITLACCLASNVKKYKRLNNDIENRILIPLVSEKNYK